jgi:integrase
VLALEWQDIDFENLSMKVVQAVVHGRVKTVKTEYSEDELPLDPDFATILLDWKIQRQKEAAKYQIQPHLWGRIWYFAAPSPRVTITRLPSSRITFVLPGAAWWSVRSAAQVPLSGV